MGDQRRADRGRRRGRRLSLWDWATRAYAAPGAEAACLRLQDHYGQSVSYLLWAAWAAAEVRGIDADLAVRAAAHAVQWEEQVLRPLRAVRRDAALDLRAERLAQELVAERRLMEQLEQMTPPSTETKVAVTDALVLAVAHWPTPAPRETLQSLSRIFADLCSC